MKRNMMTYILILVLSLLFISLLGFWSNVRPQKIDLGYLPADFSLEPEGVVLNTKDNLRLSAWYIPKKDKNKNDRSAIMILHGYPAEKSDMLSFAKALNPYFSTLLLDMRYFGKSEGKYSTLGCREQDDLSQAVDFLKNKGYEKIGVLGFSLGGAVGIMAAEKDERINAVVSYASFSNLPKLARELYWFLPVVNYPMVELMDLFGKAFFGCDFKKDSPENSAKQLKIPVLISHSMEDEQISFSHAKDLERSLKGDQNAEFYFFEKGRHGYLPADFNERLIKFFEKSL